MAMIYWDLSHFQSYLIFSHMRSVYVSPGRVRNDFSVLQHTTSEVDGVFWPTDCWFFKSILFFFPFSQLLSTLLLLLLNPVSIWSALSHFVGSPICFNVISSWFIILLIQWNISITVLAVSTDHELVLKYFQRFIKAIQRKVMCQLRWRGHWQVRRLVLLSPLHSKYLCIQLFGIRVSLLLVLYVAFKVTPLLRLWQIFLQ